MLEKLFIRTLDMDMIQSMMGRIRKILPWTLEDQRSPEKQSRTANKLGPLKDKLVRYKRVYHGNLFIIVREVMRELLYDKITYNFTTVL